MATRDHAPAGAPTWIDLMSADTGRARAFYGELFGWECQEPNPDFGGYANFTKDGVMVAGLMGKMEEALPDMWSVYLEVADADASVAALKAHGGQVFAGPHPVGDLGVMVVATDAGGSLIGMWQSKEHTGFGVHNETNAPAWFELLTPDYAGALDFYPSVFGWNLRTEADTPEFRYSVMQEGELQYAGIMDAGHLPEGAPQGWRIYIEVASADDTAAKVVALGGTVTQEPVDTPYGRLVGCTDPMGAVFNTMQPPADQG